jgi:hypothetical protein
MIPNF